MYIIIIIPHTLLYTIEVHKTDVVTVCLFRIFAFEKSILNPVIVAKHLVVLTVLE